MLEWSFTGEEWGKPEFLHCMSAKTVNTTATQQGAYFYSQSHR